MKCHQRSLWNYQANNAYLSYKPLISALSNETGGGKTTESKIKSLLASSNSLTSEEAQKKKIMLELKKKESFSLSSRQEA